MTWKDGLNNNPIFMNKFENSKTLEANWRFLKY
jgi:hypothetical protein